MARQELEVERSRHGALFDSFTETEGSSRRGSSYAGQEYHRLSASAAVNEQQQQQRATRGGSLRLPGAQAQALRLRSALACFSRADEVSRVPDGGKDGGGDGGDGDGGGAKASGGGGTSRRGSFRVGLEFFRGLRGTARRGSAKTGSVLAASLQRQQLRRVAAAEPRDIGYYRALAAAWKASGGRDGAGSEYEGFWMCRG